MIPLRPDDPAQIGAYALEGVLGEGGQGIVYLGRSPAGDRVAVKLLHRAGDPNARVRLARELATIKKVAQFCTARVLDADLEAAQPYVISEFIDGPSLQEKVTRDGPLTGGDLDRLAVGTASALAAIHRAGVLHRDFKPPNVLLGPDGPRVVDFGIARDDDATTITSGLIGTPGYLAPEQLHGRPATPATDVFAWAATIVYAATGRSPFGSDTVAAIFNRVLNEEPRLDGVAPAFRALLAACLAKPPEARPGIDAVMARLLDPDAPVETITVPDLPASTVPGASRSPFRGKWAALGAVAVAIALMTGAGLWLLLGRESSPPPRAGGQSVALVSSGKLTVCSSRQPSDLESGLLNLIAKDLGAERVDVRTPIRTIVDGDALKTGRCDVASGVLVNDERKNLVTFSRPYYKLRCVLVAKKDSGVDSIGNAESVAVQVTSPCRSIVTGAGASTRQFPDPARQFGSLLGGETEAAFADLTYALDWTRKNSGYQLGQTYTLGDEYAFAIAKGGDSALLARIEAVLAAAQASGEWGQFYRNWSGLEPSATP